MISSAPEILSKNKLKNIKNFLTQERALNTICSTFLKQIATYSGLNIGVMRIKFPQKLSPSLKQLTSHTPFSWAKFTIDACVSTEEPQHVS
jgi:hypothetical protein